MTARTIRWMSNGRLRTSFQRMRSAPWRVRAPANTSLHFQLRAKKTVNSSCGGHFTNIRLHIDYTPIHVHTRGCVRIRLVIYTFIYFHAPGLSVLSIIQRRRLVKSDYNPNAHEYKNPVHFALNHFYSYVSAQV